jgi:hypothetical protein
MSIEPNVPATPASEPSGSATTAAPEPAQQPSAIQQELSRSGVLAAFGLTPTPDPAATAPVEDKAVPAGQTKPDENPNPTEKELTNLKSVLGRQSNELGELRKKTAEYEQKLAELATKSQAPATPPVAEIDYDAVIKASDADLEAAIRRKAVEQGAILSDAEVALEAKTIRMDARLAKAEKVTHALEQKNQELEQARQIEERDIAFFKAHPEMQARADKIAALAKQMFPDVKNIADIAKMGFDPYSIMHTLYELAALVPAMGQKAVADAVAGGQAAALASQGGFSSTPAKTAGEKISPVRQELINSFPDLFK